MEKNLYIKTEPGGKVAFGHMPPSDIEIFNKSKVNGFLSKDILFKLKKGLGSYKLYEGVFNYGCDGALGNEGVIKLSDDIVEIPKLSLDILELRYYAVYLALSKVSVEFKIIDRKEIEYNPKELSEISVKVNLPNCVKHQTYSELNCNVVTSYAYRGKIIKNANKSLVHRGYEEVIFIFSVEGKNTNLLYSNVEQEEIFF
jgi:hypothetical protein